MARKICGIFLLVLVLSGSTCTEKQGSLVSLDLTNAGMDIITSSPTIKGIETFKAVEISSLTVNTKILEKGITIEELNIFKTYPKGKYQKVVRKFENGKIRQENVETSESKGNDWIQIVIGCILLIIAGYFLGRKRNG